VITIAHPPAIPHRISARRITATTRSTAADSTLAYSQTDELPSRPARLGVRLYRATVTLRRADIEGVLAAILTRVPETKVRLVGTASSVMRDIPLPANDIDILFHDRAGVDAWFGVLSADFDVDCAPGWMAESQQYFARVHAGAVAVELSTVEIESDDDTIECFGEGPWRYFDLLPCGPRTVPAVATELRLVTEVARGRTDRVRPIVDHLRRTGCDVALIRRGLAQAGVAANHTDQIIAELRRGGRS
jgi:hypothetical protein